MTLEPLQKFSQSYQAAANPGRPPKLEWLDLRKLTINTRYQRPITAGGMNTIKRIMAGFSWSRFSPVIVRRVPGPEECYEIIDGQHRSTAALNCGYDNVPAMVVACDEDEAARIFAAVNGNVTPMQPMAVYKAALAGGEDWARQCKAAAEAAGCSILTYALPRGQQKPLQTMSIQAVRQVWRSHGPGVLEATFKLLTASSGSDVPGFLSSYLIKGWSRVLASRPGWVRDIATVQEAIRQMNMNLSLLEVEEAERRLAARMGDGRSRVTGEISVIKEKVADAMGRRLSAQFIATQLRLPYAFVEQLMAEIRAETPKLEARR